MAKKRANPNKSGTRKKAAAAGAKKKLSGTATSKHHDYEAKIGVALKAMWTDVQAIRNNLDDNDPNTAPTEGITKRIKALIDETTVVSIPVDHENRIERILYAIAGMDDQYYIDGDTPDSDAYEKPTGTTHEERVGQLFTIINSITRDVLDLLDSQEIPNPQPKRSDYGDNDVTDFIVAIAGDTRDVVVMIEQHIPSHRRIFTSK